MRAQFSLVGCIAGILLIGCSTAPVMRHAISVVDLWRAKCTVVQAALDSVNNLVCQREDSLRAQQERIDSLSGRRPLRLPLIGEGDSLVIGDTVIRFINPAVRAKIQQAFMDIVQDPNLWLSWHVRLGRYEELIREQLRENGAPEIYIGLIMWESRLNAAAMSKAGARGLAQFIKSTARLYGLTVNQVVDERLNPLFCLRAAAVHLVDLTEGFGSPLLAIAAYNGGESRLKHYIASQGTADVFALDLREETDGYIYQVPATMLWYLRKNELFPWLSAVPRYKPWPRVVEVQCVLKRATVVTDLAMSYAVAPKEFKKVNGHLLAHVLPRGKYRLLIPQP